MEVTFDAGEEGQVLGEPRKQVVFKQPYGELPGAFRPGYGFGGWLMGPGEVSLLVVPGAIVATREPHTLHAHWFDLQVIVRFDSSGGSDCEPVLRTYQQPYGDLCVPTRVGYTFVGWYRPEATQTLISPESTVETGDDHVLYAGWEAIPYHVQFDAMGGSTCEDITVQFDRPYGALCRSTREGYDLKGWYVSDVDATAPVTDETPVQEARDHILVARWTGKSVRVTFDGQGGTACAERMVTVGAHYGELCTPVLDNFSFLGWFDTVGPNAIRIEPTTEVTIPRSHTLHAHWRPDSPPP